MDLLDRYLNAVRLALVGSPRKDDIIAELRDDLMSRIEARESDLGRRLTDAEVEDVLKANGHPLIAAGRYRQRQYLIGPTILPFYEAAVAGLLALLAVLAVIQALTSRSPVQGLHDLIGAYLSSAITMIGAATVVAVLLERFEVRLGFIDNWRPRDLPSFDTATWNKSALARRCSGRGWMLKPKSRWESLFELVATLVFLSWWIGLVNWPLIWDVRHGLHFTVRPDPIWHELYWPIVALGLTQVAASAVRFAQPHWTRTGAALDLISALFGIAMVALIAQSGDPWIQVQAGDFNGQEVANFNRMLQIIIPISLWVAGVIWGLQALGALYRLVRGAGVRASVA